MASTRVSVSSSAHHTLIYDWGTLGIRRVRSKFADIHRCTLFNTQRQTCQRMRAYSKNVMRTLNIRNIYDVNARHALNTLDFR